MNYRGPGFLAVIWFGSLPIPFPTSKLSLFLSLKCVAGQAYWREKGWARSQFIRPPESLSLYKSVKKCTGIFWYIRLLTNLHHLRSFYKKNLKFQFDFLKGKSLKWDLLQAKLQNYIFKKCQSEQYIFLVNRQLYCKPFNTLECLTRVNIFKNIWKGMSIFYSKNSFRFHICFALYCYSLRYITEM